MMKMLQESAKNGIPIIVSSDGKKRDVLNQAEKLGVSVEVYTANELRKKYANG